MRAPPARHCRPKRGSAWSRPTTGFASPASSKTTGDVPNVDADESAALAERAKATCPVSLALAGTEITARRAT